MADKPKTVLIKLDAITWSNPLIIAVGGGGYLSVGASPYLWTVFFTVDGTSVRLNEAGFLAGTANLFPTGGKHGDLGIWSLNPLETVGIPDPFGFFSSELLPIPVDPSVQLFLDAAKASNPSLDVDPHAVFGFVAVLLQDGGHIPAHAVDAGRDALTNALQSFIDSQLTETLGILQPTIAPAALQQALDDIHKAVKNAIIDSMSVWEKAWAISGSDESIASWIGIFNASQASVVFNEQSVSDEYGTWSLNGSVTIADACAAQAVADAIEVDIAAIASSKNVKSTPKPNPRAGLEAMRQFRDTGGLRKYPGLINWWRQAREHIGETVLILSRDRKLRTIATRLLSGVGELLENLRDPVPPDYLKQSAELFAGLERKGSLSLKAFSRRASAIIRQSEGLKGNDALRLWEKSGTRAKPTKTPPARKKTNRSRK